MADAGAVEDVDFTKLPIDERCQHKVSFSKTE